MICPICEQGEILKVKNKKVMIYFTYVKNVIAFGQRKFQTNIFRHLKIIQKEIILQIHGQKLRLLTEFNKW